VSIQYRVNLFGFLYLDDKDASGNQGLFDQRLALKWINENIESFGGDSSRITIVGESAGGASVSFHLLSSPSWPLFNNAILQSGAPLCPWAKINDKELALERNTNIANYIGCNQTTIKAKIVCLREMDAQTALSKADEYFYSQANKGILQFTFLPVVDGDFFRDTPQNLLEKKHFKKVKHFSPKLCPKVILIPLENFDSYKIVGAKIELCLTSGIIIFKRFLQGKLALIKAI
jgi:carboxylesterase type B